MGGVCAAYKTAQPRVAVLLDFFRGLQGFGRFHTDSKGTLDFGNLNANFARLSSPRHEARDCGLQPRRPLGARGPLLCGPRERVLASAVRFRSPPRAARTSR